MTITLTRPARSLAAAVGAVVLVAAGLVFWRVDGQDSPEAQHGTAAVDVPYDDAQSAGLLTLCSADGEPVTGGGLQDRPFADVVVGDTGIPAELDATGAVGTVFVYQPRAGVSTTEFSGTALTAAAELGDPGSPAVPVTEDAWTLGDFVTAYPADDDGFVQLRLYLGTPGAGTLSDHPYDTADLRVVGDRWELVRGGSASCADAADALASPAR